MAKQKRKKRAPKPRDPYARLLAEGARAGAQGAHEDRRKRRRGNRRQERDRAIREYSD